MENWKTIHIYIYDRVIFFSRVSVFPATTPTSASKTWCFGTNNTKSFFQTNFYNDLDSYQEWNILWRDNYLLTIYSYMDHYISVIHRYFQASSPNEIDLWHYAILHADYRCNLVQSTVDNAHHHLYFAPNFCRRPCFCSKKTFLLEPNTIRWF